MYPVSYRNVEVNGVIKLSCLEINRWPNCANITSFLFTGVGLLVWWWWWWWKAVYKYVSVFSSGHRTDELMPWRAIHSSIPPQFTRNSTPQSFSHNLITIPHDYHHIWPFYRLWIAKIVSWIRHRRSGATLEAFRSVSQHLQTRCLFRFSLDEKTARLWWLHYNLTFF